MPTTKLLARVPLSLAEAGIWSSPAELVLIHHTVYVFNGCRQTNVVELMLAEDEDVDELDRDDAEPSDLTGTTVCMHEDDLRVLAAALTAAADEIAAMVPSSLPSSPESAA